MDIALLKETKFSYPCKKLFQIIDIHGDLKPTKPLMIPLSSRYHRMRIKTVKKLNNSCFSFALQADKWDIENKNKKKQRSTFPEIVKKIVKYCTSIENEKSFPILASQIFDISSQFRFFQKISTLWEFQRIMNASQVFVLPSASR